MTTETVEITYSNFVIGIFAALAHMGYTGIVPPELDYACVGDKAAIETYRYISEQYPKVHTRFCIYPGRFYSGSDEWRQQLREQACFVFRPIRSDDNLLYFNTDALRLYIQDARYFPGSEAMWKDLSEHFRAVAEPALHSEPYRHCTYYL